MGKRRAPRKMLGLAQEWEKEAAVRACVREQKVLLRCNGPTFRPRVENVAIHKELLLPVVAWMATLPKQPVPDIVPLQKEIKAYYGMCNLVAGQDQIYRESWGIRHAAGHIKRKGRRRELTKAGHHAPLWRAHRMCVCVCL